MKRIAKYKKLNGVRGALPFFEAVQVLFFGEIKFFVYEIPALF